MADISPYILNEATENGIEKENSRLDFQHYFFDDIMNNELLPPHIARELATKPSPRICEMATGSAIWLKELAKTLPMSAELVGLDFDTSKFPRPETLASNIKLDFANAYEPFPEEFQSHFDVVHLRHFILATKKDQGARLVQNLLSLLRPGGWLVWAECDPIKTNAEPPSDAMFRMQKVYYNHLRNADLETDLPYAMTSYMRQAGLVDCDDRAYISGSVLFGPKGSGWLARAHHEFFVTFCRVLKGILNRGGVDGMRTQQDLDQLVADMREEISGTRKCLVPVIRAWGRKSS